MPRLLGSNVSHVHEHTPLEGAGVLLYATRAVCDGSQGLQGVMWVMGGDNRTEPPQLPDFSSVEGVQAAARQPHAHLHASLLHALAGPHAEVAEQPGAQVLAASGLGLEQARATDPVFSLTMQRTLLALRLFTFS